MAISYWDNTGGTLRDDLDLWDKFKYYTTGLKVPSVSDTMNETNTNAVSPDGGISSTLGSFYKDITPEGFGWNKGTLDTIAALGKVWVGHGANEIAQEQTDATKQHLGHRMEMDKLNAAMKYYDAQAALDTRKHNLAVRGIDIPVYELPDSVFRPEFTKVG